MSIKKYQKISEGLGSRLHFFGVLHLILMALIGQPLEISTGLVAYPPLVIELQSPFNNRVKKHRKKPNQNDGCI